MNIVKLIGNVGRDINVKDFESGKMASFSLATNETYTNKNREEVRATTWHSIVAWGPVALRCEALLEKGKLVAIEGRINYRHIPNKENSGNIKLAEIVAFKVDEVKKSQDGEAEG